MEDRNNDLEGNNFEITQRRTKEKILKSKESECDLQNSIKHASIRIIWTPNGGEERKFYLKKISENFPNLGRDLGIQVHEIYRSFFFYLNAKDLLKNSIMKLLKIKDKDKS